MTPFDHDPAAPALTRRYFLRSTGALAATLGVVPRAVLARAAGVAPEATRTTEGRTLVVVFLRGGADGLNLVVPHGDADYARLRPALAVARPGREGGAIDLDGFFGLHPQLAALAPRFADGSALALQAVGRPGNTRSHFEEQDAWETGVSGTTIDADGWVNRHLATSTGHGTLRAVAIGDALPRLLQGREASYALRGVEDLALPDQAGAGGAAIAAALEHAYAVDSATERDAAREVLARSAQATLEGTRELAGIVGRPYRPDAAYPATDFARRLAQVARLIKADVGLEVAEVDLGGWDTHREQGTGAGGTFGALARTLAEGLAAFTADLGERMDRVVVATLTDFGRTAAENGTRGTDHGWANAMLLLGGPVGRARAEGLGPVAGDWPGLAPDRLHEGRDLRHTTDFRDVIAEVVRVHLGNPNLGTVLPGHAVRPVGVVRA